jgi:hypothetical protein
MVLTLEYYGPRKPIEYSATEICERREITDGEVPVFISNFPKTPARQSARGPINPSLAPEGGEHTPDRPARTGTYVNSQTLRYNRRLTSLVRYKSLRRLWSLVRDTEKVARRDRHTIHPRRGVRISVRAKENPTVLTALALPPCEWVVRGENGRSPSNQEHVGGCASLPCII